MIKNQKICAICGNLFPSSPSDKTVTCSPECSKIRKKQTHTGKNNKWNEESRKNLREIGETANLKKGTPAAMLSPKSGSFETNINAKKWTLKAPDGSLHSFKNLNLWAKNNSFHFATFNL